MPTEPGTRDRIVDAGASHVIRKGYHPTGIKDVLADAGVPKGSFYHWFSSKEEFGLAVLDRYVREYDHYLDSVLGDPDRSPVDRLARFFDDGIARFEDIGAVDGCMVGNLSQELGDQDESFRQALEAALIGWRDRIAAVLTQAQAAGEVGEEIDPATTADFILDAWEGALLRMKVQASVEPLRTCKQLVLEQVLRG